MSKNKNFVDLNNVITGADEVTSVINTPIGDFTLKLLTPRQKIKVAKDVSQYLGGVNASMFAISDTDYKYTQMIATLQEAIIEHPKNFTVSECYDDHLLSELYDEYLELETVFRSSLSKKFHRDSLSGQQSGISNNATFQNTSNG